MTQPYMEFRPWCTLVNEECEWSNCEGCPNNTPKLTPHEENLQECEFVQELIIDHILPAMINRGNTIAEVQQGNTLITFIKHYNLQKTGYSPTNLKQYPQLFMLKKTLNLGIPHKIYSAINKPCVVIYDDVAYVIAPRIESEI
jgi:hypothetical protein